MGWDRLGSAIGTGAIVATLLLAGCKQEDAAATTLQQGVGSQLPTPEAAADADRAAAPEDMRQALPTIHAVLEFEAVENGVNKRKEDYFAAVNACRALGKVPHELSAEDIAKLDTGEVEIMIDAHAQKVRITSWTLQVDPAVDPDAEGGTAAICHQIAKKEVEEFEAAPDDGEFLPISAEKNKETLAATEAMGVKRVGEGHVAGLPCTRWHDAQQGMDTCMWSGGLQWGIDNDYIDYGWCSGGLTNNFLDAIPLAVKSTGKAGCNIRVKSISIGKPSRLPVRQ